MSSRIDSGESCGNPRMYRGRDDPDGVPGRNQVLEVVRVVLRLPRRLRFFGLMLSMPMKTFEPPASFAFAMNPGVLYDCVHLHHEL